MIFKQTITVLIVLLLFNQPAFAERVDSVKAAQEYLSKNISDILKKKVGDEVIKSDASIGIRGILYNGKHTKLSEKIEKALGRRFANDSKFKVYSRSKLMDSAAKKELKQQRDFHYDSFDTIPLGQFKSIQILITGEISNHADGVTIDVTALKVETLEEIAIAAVEIPMSVANDYLVLSDKGKSMLEAKEAKTKEKYLEEINRRTEINKRKVDDAWRRTGIPRLGLTPLHYAANAGDIRTVKLMLGHREDVNASTKDGWTPLLLAVAAGQHKIDMVKLLIDSGADVNASTKYGSTPLYNALLFGKNINIVKLLIDNGADVNARNHNGATLLPLAIVLSLYRKNTDMIKLLINRGADVNARNYNGRTPLSGAIDRRGAEIDIVKLLIDNGADINAQDSHNGATPLHLAIYRKNTDMIKLLINRGANTQIKDKKGRRPIDIARSDKVRALLRR